MVDWILAQDAIVVYLALFCLQLTAIIGFPPEDLILIVGGILLHQAKVQWEFIFLSCYVGILFGDIGIYAMGRYCTRTEFVRKYLVSINPHKIKRVQLQLEKRSILMIFISRHLIYLRTVTFFTCGMVKMRFLKFLAADALAALISVPLMLWLGWLASEHYHELLDFLSKVKYTLLAVVLLGVAAFFVRRKLRARGERPGNDAAS